MRNVPTVLAWARMIFSAICVSTITASAQVIVGNCNVVIKDVKISAGSLNLAEIGCPQDPSKTLRVGYYWLDANSASFLFAGANYGAIRDLMGSRPFIVQNATYTEAKYLIEKFGTYWDQDSFQSYRVVVEKARGKSEGKSDKADFENISPSHRRVRVYGADGTIYLPDLTAVVAVNKSLKWPDNYRLYFTEDPNFIVSGPLTNSASTLVNDGLFRVSVLWRTATRDDLTRYAENVNTLREATLRDGRALPYIPHDAQGWIYPSQKELEDLERRSGGDSDKYAKLLTAAEIKKLPNLAQNPALSAMLYISRKNWPADFLHVFGTFEGHGYAGEWNTVVPPRKLYLQVAVIENVGGTGATYQVSGFNMRRSERDDLRRIAEDSAERSEFVSFVPGVLAKGDKVVLPLRIEFREDLREGFRRDVTPSSQTATQVKTLLRNLSVDSVLTDGSKQVRKSRGVFDAVEVPKVSPVYIFGPRFSLASVAVDNKPVPMRQLDPNKLYMVSGFEGGSCPVLFVKRMGFNEPIKLGHILVRAVGRENALTEEIELGEGVSEIYLAENEPESTHIEWATIARLEENGTKSNLISASNITIEHGQIFKLALPEGAEKGKYVLRIRGYYQPYATMVK